MRKEIDQSVTEIWQAFIKMNKQYANQKMPESYYFCDNEFDANDCAGLVVKGIKQATAGSQWWYDQSREPIANINDLFIITDWNGIAKAIIQIIKIEKTPYNEITPEFAEIEGEGDKSLTYWKKVHWDYFSREMLPYNETPTEDMIIVCEHFKTLWKVD